MSLRYVFMMGSQRQFSGVMRPFVVFYYSASAQRAMTTTWRVLPSVSTIVLLELYIVLVYACLCFVLYSQPGSPDGSTSFRSLSWAFVHLYELSTTVNNPDIWLHLNLRRYRNQPAPASPTSASWSQTGPIRGRVPRHIHAHPTLRTLPVFPTTSAQATGTG